jgi:hypothetical protein
MRLSFGRACELGIGARGETMISTLRPIKPHTLDDLASHRCSGFRQPVTGNIVLWWMNDAAWSSCTTSFRR